MPKITQLTSCEAESNQVCVYAYHLPLPPLSLLAWPGRWGYLPWLPPGEKVKQAFSETQAVPPVLRDYNKVLDPWLVSCVFLGT